MEKSKLPTGNVPFVGRMKDRKESVIMNASIRAFDRRFRHAKSHQTMKKQYIPERWVLTLKEPIRRLRRMGAGVNWKEFSYSKLVAFTPAQINKFKRFIFENPDKGTLEHFNGKLIWHDASAMHSGAYKKNE